MLYYKHNESQIRGTGTWREGREDHEGGGNRVKMTPNTSVLTLSAATTHDRKHGPVQISLKCRLAASPAEVFPALGFYMQRLMGIICRPAFTAASAGQRQHRLWGHK